MTHRALLIVWIYLNSRSANWRSANAGLLALIFRTNRWAISKMTYFEPANVVCQSWTNKWSPAIWDKSIFAPDKSPLIFLSVKNDKNEDTVALAVVKAILYPLSDQIGYHILVAPLSIASNVFVYILVGRSSWDMAYGWSRLYAKITQTYFS